jgi:hypothetical protein
VKCGEGAHESKAGEPQLVQAAARAPYRLHVENDQVSGAVVRGEPQAALALLAEGLWELGIGGGGEVDSDSGAGLLQTSSPPPPHPTPPSHPSPLPPPHAPPGLPPSGPSCLHVGVPVVHTGHVVATVEDAQATLGGRHLPQGDPGGHDHGLGGALTTVPDNAPRWGQGRPSRMRKERSEMDDFHMWPARPSGCPLC